MTDEPPTADGPVVPAPPIAAARPAAGTGAAARSARKPRPPQQTQAKSRPEPARSARRILLVEDHEDSAETLAIILTMKGYEVTVAHSLAEATHQAAGCDLVISDISLPDGSGLDLPRLLRREPPLPAIAMSGYGTERDRRRSLEAGFAEHLTKPVNIEQLLAALGRLASRSPTTA